MECKPCLIIRQFSDLRKIKTENWAQKPYKHHQKHPTGFTTLGVYLQRDFPKTKNLFHYTYLTQLLQAEAMKTAIYAHRLAKPYCMGTFVLAAK